MENFKRSIAEIAKHVERLEMRIAESEQVFENLCSRLMGYVPHELGDVCFCDVRRVDVEEFIQRFKKLTEQLNVRPEQIIIHLGDGYDEWRNIDWQSICKGKRFVLAYCFRPCDILKALSDVLAAVKPSSS